MTYDPLGNTIEKLYDLIDLYTETEEYKKVVSTCDEINEYRCGQDSWAYFRRAQANYELGDYKDALEDVEIAIEYGHDESNSFELKADICKALGMHKEAEEALQQAKELEF